MTSAGKHKKNLSCSRYGQGEGGWGVAHLTMSGHGCTCVMHAWTVRQTDGSTTWAAAGLQRWRTAAIGGADIWRERVSRLKTPAKDEEAPASSKTPSRHLLAASSGASPSSAVTSAYPFGKQAVATKAFHEIAENA